jgi:hypothetical protein
MINDEQDVIGGEKGEAQAAPQEQSMTDVGIPA